tara:strand:- start:55 stop:447 length:393 start_codon:yes stop_codon:yes gene_type:complete
MAHFVEIDASNIVIRGVVLDDKDTQDENGDEVESVGATYLSDGFGGTWKRTSYNTYGGVHNLGGTPFRKNYAGIGYTYDAAKDAFYSPKPYPSWTLNEDTCQWDAPTAYPDDGKRYSWNEGTTSWDEVPE